MSKTGNERDPFGSTFWRNKPRANFRIKSDAEPGARSFTLGLKHTKTNNGITFPDKAFRLSFEGPDARNPDLLRLQTAEPEDIPDWIDNQTSAQRLAYAMRRGTMTTGESHEETGIPEGTIESTLSRHKDDMFVIVKTDGRTNHWCLLGRTHDLDLPNGARIGDCF